jgi:hypothetical protein
VIRLEDTNAPARFRRSLEALGRASSSTTRTPTDDLEDLIVAGNRLARIIDAAQRGPVAAQVVSSAVLAWDVARDRYGDLT